MYGTGFAHPKRRLLPVTISKNGTSNEPTGSMCFIGFGDNLPASFAVESPKEYAVYPCASSCKITEIISMTIYKAFDYYISF